MYLEESGAASDAASIVGKVVLGWDPAFRTGCKLAVVDETGKVLDTTVVYPKAPTNDAKRSVLQKMLRSLIKSIMFL